jgi:hypothetical protein
MKTRMNSLTVLTLTLFLLTWASLTANAQIPGFVEKWKISVDDTNDFSVYGIGRDGAVAMDRYDDSYHHRLYWISSDGGMVTKIEGSELGFPDFDSLNVVLVLNSNLIVQAWEGQSNMQITQITRGGGQVISTITKLVSPPAFPQQNLSDYSCPERLMFVQEGYTLRCYRPAADIAAPLTGLTITGVTQSATEVFVTSSQGGPLQLQGSTNLLDWQSITNIQTMPGVMKVILPATNPARFFYRGKRQ